MCVCVRVDKEENNRAKSDKETKCKKENVRADMDEKGLVWRGKKREIWIKKYQYERKKMKIKEIEFKE